MLENNTTIGALPLVVGILGVVFGWIPFLGLKVLRPQEALVLTLFGQYIGTLKEPGFYFVNPFSVGINPAANTRLGQSGEADNSASSSLTRSTMF